MRSFFAELRRRNVLRAAALYIGAGWALSQGVAQILPVFDIPNWVVRWFVIAAIIGFPFAMLFSWFYEWTAHGIVRESEVAPSDSVNHSTDRKLDFAIIGVLSIAVVLLLTNTFVSHKETGAVAAALDKSIAVLPLTNESGDKDQQYFSDGLSEDLITALSQFSGLKVIGRNSSFQFRDSKDDSKTIGTKLGVAHLLEGSVRRAGDAVRISAELVNAADGSTLWSDHYDRPYTDLFKLQDEITQSVAGALKTKLLANGTAAAQSDRPPSGNLNAYNAYLHGQFYYARYTPQDFRTAIDHYSAAIRLDSHYAQAYAALSYAWTALAANFLDGEQVQEAYAESRVAVDTALTLAPDLAVAHLARGYLLADADFDWNGADAEYRRALELAPNDAAVQFAFGNMQAILGQPARAVELTRQVLTSDPLNAIWYSYLSLDLMPLGRLDEAAQAIRKALDLQPEAAEFHQQQTMVEILRGDAKAALATAQQEPPGFWHDSAMAMALQIGDDRVAADTALKNQIDKDGDTSPYQIAEVHALRKDPDQTFAWLDRAWTQRDTGIQYLLYDSFILRYQHDPRFAAFCKKVGIPTTTEAKALP